MPDEAQMVPVSSRTLAEIADRMNASQIPWGVFAGAARVYGSPRPLRDIDILIPTDAGGIIAAYFPDADLGYNPDGSIAELILSGCEIIAGLTQYVSLEMDAPMIARLRFGELLGIEISTLSLEDNLAFKAILGRGPEVGKHDWEDIAMMMACNPQIDWDYLGWRLDQCVTDRASDLIAHLHSMGGII
jgi:hypothetical protein